jgi:hypothetical protein
LISTDKHDRLTLATLALQESGCAGQLVSNGNFGHLQCTSVQIFVAAPIVESRQTGGTQGEPCSAITPGSANTVVNDNSDFYTMDLL